VLGRWVRQLLWRPFELGCRVYPLLPLCVEVTLSIDPWSLDPATVNPATETEGPPCTSL
jgi:hypothetical protein